jgi:hypothetical protein
LCIVKVVLIFLSISAGGSGVGRRWYALEIRWKGIETIEKVMSTIFLGKM